MEPVSERIILKEINRSDLESVHALYCCPETDRYNTLGIPESTGKTREIIQAFIRDQSDASRKSYAWKIVRRDTGAFIGMAGITLSADRFRRGEIWYELLPSHWGAGYATEAARRIVRAGFEKFGLHRIEAWVDSRNLACKRAAGRLGFRQEGTLRECEIKDGRYIDLDIYALLENEQI